MVEMNDMKVICSFYERVSMIALLLGLIKMVIIKYLGGHYEQNQ